MIEPKLQLDFLTNINHIDHMMRQKDHPQYKQYVGFIYEQYCIFVLLQNGYKAMSWRDYALNNGISIKDIGIDIMCYTAGSNIPTAIQCKYRKKYIEQTAVDHYYMNLQRCNIKLNEHSMLITNVKCPENWKYKNMEIVRLSESIVNYKLWLNCKDYIYEVPRIIVIEPHKSFWIKLQDMYKNIVRKF